MPLHSLCATGKPETNTQGKARNKQTREGKTSKARKSKKQTLGTQGRMEKQATNTGDTLHIELVSVYGFLKVGQLRFAITQIKHETES